MAQRKGISTGTTAQRTVEEAGKMRFNTTTNLMEYYDGNDWKSIDSPPTVASVSPSNLLSGDGTGNYTIVVTGSLFSSSVTAEIITESGTSITPDTTTRDSSTQATLVVAKNKTNLTNANEPFDIKITNSSGLAATLADALTIDASPIYSTAAGSLGTVSDSARASTTLTVVAADPESGGDVTYSLESGSLPAGATLTSTSSGGVISGFNAVGSNTTSNFTIRAKDVNSNVSDRAFSITVNAPVISSFTSSGTFSVPSGVSSVNVLVVAGGGAGHGTYHGAGGGAGGLIYRPGFPVTPGGTVTVTVGEGGTHPHSNAGTGPATDPGRGEQSSQIGQDSVFGTLTAKGGGRGGGNPSDFTTLAGGSGGGTGQHPQSAGGATQPTQSGDSGNYGFGNPGGTANTPGSWTSAGGGGGAGAAGGSVSQPAPGSPNTAVGAGSGGAGKAYTIADGTTSVYYAGGGGGSAGRWPAVGSGGQGGGGSGSPGRGEDGTANRGGGGGGGERNSLGDYPGAFGQPGGAQTNFDGGSGGKGIVIVAY